MKNQLQAKLIAFNIRELDDAAKELTNVTADSSVWQLRLAGVAVAKPLLREPAEKAHAVSAVREKKSPRVKKKAPPGAQGRSIISLKKPYIIVHEDGTKTPPLSREQAASRAAKKAVNLIKRQRSLSKDLDERADVRELTALLARVLAILPLSANLRPIKIGIIPPPKNELGVTTQITLTIDFWGDLTIAQVRDLTNLFQPSNTAWQSLKQGKRTILQISRLF